MPTTTTAQGFPVMVDGDDPNIPEDIMNLTKAIEKRVMGVYNTATDRNTKLPTPEEGQVAYLKDTNTFTFYTGSAWTNMFTAPPTFTSGATVPANTSGSNGDVFFKV